MEMNNQRLLDEAMRLPATDERSKFLAELAEKEKRFNNLSEELKRLVPRTEPTEPHFSTDSITVVGIVAAVIIAILFVLHCIIWVVNLIVDIEWDTWGWTVTAFWWGLGITAFVAIATIAWYFYSKDKYAKDLDAYHNYVNTKERLKQDKKKTSAAIINDKKKVQDSLTKDIREIVEVPIDDKAIQFEDKDEAEKLLADFVENKQIVSSCEDIAMRGKLYDDLMNKKLSIFYILSIKGESTVTYPFFQKQLASAQKKNDYNLLRIEEKNATALSHLNKIGTYTQLLNNNKMTPILNDLNEVKEISTNNWLGFTSVNALAEKTEMLQELFKAASYEYKELASVNEEISYLLEYVRVCAYRNIYLGAELLNYIRDNAGGKSLTTEKGMVEIDVKLQDINVSAKSLKMDVLGNISTTVNSYINAGVELLDNKEVKKFIGKNPKAATGLAAAALIGGAAINLMDERNEKIEQNNRIQKDVIKNIQKMVSNYTKGQGTLLRAIEIIKAITKANSGFMQVYEPLKVRVFDKKDVTSVTMQDISQLVIATNEYNKISKAKL